MKTWRPERTHARRLILISQQWQPSSSDQFSCKYFFCQIKIERTRASDVKMFFSWDKNRQSYGLNLFKGWGHKNKLKNIFRENIKFSRPELLNIHLIFSVTLYFHLALWAEGKWEIRYQFRQHSIVTDQGNQTQCLGNSVTMYF